MKRTWSITFANSTQGQIFSRFANDLRDRLGAQINDLDIQQGSQQLEFGESLPIKLVDIINVCGPGSVRYASVDTRHETSLNLLHGITMIQTKGYKFELNDIQSSDHARIDEFDQTVKMAESC